MSDAAQRESGHGDIDRLHECRADHDIGRDRVVEVAIAPSEAQREGIAHWLGVERLDALKANIALSRAGADEYAYRGHFEADVVQACVVTLEPVPSHLSGEISPGASR